MSENLYPIKFTPILKEKIWGGNKLEKILYKRSGNLSKVGESWEISGVEGNISVVSNGILAGNSLQELIEIYMGDLVGEKVYEKFGIEFPLLIKFIDAQDNLSIQVHPNDEVSMERHKAYGKTEMWYVVQADTGSELISGFKESLSKGVYLHALESAKLKDILNVEMVREGDLFFIPAGRVHAIGSGILLAEIQQTSDITYRIYDWERVDNEGNSRELHTDLALDVIDFEAQDSYKTNYLKTVNETVNLIGCKYFTTNILEFDKAVEKEYVLIDSFVIYMCLEGSFTVQYDNGREEKIEKGETVLIPANLKNIVLLPKDKTKLLEVYIVHN